MPGVGAKTLSSPARGWDAPACKSAPGRAGNTLLSGGIPNGALPWRPQVTPGEGRGISPFLHPPPVMTLRLGVVVSGYYAGRPHVLFAPLPWHTHPATVPQFTGFGPPAHRPAGQVGGGVTTFSHTLFTHCWFAPQSALAAHCLHSPFTHT